MSLCMGDARAHILHRRRSVCNTHPWRIVSQDIASCVSICACVCVCVHLECTLHCFSPVISLTDVTCGKAPVSRCCQPDTYIQSCHGARTLAHALRVGPRGMKGTVSRAGSEGREGSCCAWMSSSASVFFVFFFRKWEQ